MVCSLRGVDEKSVGRAGAWGVSHGAGGTPLLEIIRKREGINLLVRLLATALPFTRLLHKILKVLGAGFGGALLSPEGILFVDSVSEDDLAGLQIGQGHAGLLIGSRLT